MLQAVKLTWQKPRSERVHKLFKEVKKFGMQERDVMYQATEIRRNQTMIPNQTKAS